MKRKLIYLGLIALFVYFVLENLNNGKELLNIFLLAKWEYIVIALLLQGVHYLLVSILYERTLNLYGVKWPIKELIPLVFSSQALNIFAPFLPFPGSSLFLKKARNEKVPALSIAASIFLVILFDYIALCPFLLISIYFQLIGGNVFLYEIAGIAAFLLIILALFSILVFGVLSPKILGWLFWLFEKITNKFHFLIKRRNFFIDGWSSSRTLQFIDLSKKLISNKQARRELFAVALGRHIVDTATLFLLFLAFGKTVAFSQLFVGYSLMILFAIVSPSPQGVGFVEALIPAVFKSMNVKIEIATLTTLAFRGLNLWLPVIIGFATMHSLIKKAK